MIIKITSYQRDYIEILTEFSDKLVCGYRTYLPDNTYLKTWGSFSYNRRSPINLKLFSMVVYALYNKV